MQDFYSAYFNKKLHNIQYNNRLSVIMRNATYYDTCIILSCHEIICYMYMYALRGQLREFLNSVGLVLIVSTS